MGSEIMQESCFRRQNVLSQKRFSVLFCGFRPIWKLALLALSFILVLWDKYCQNELWKGARHHIQRSDKWIQAPVNWWEHSPVVSATACDKALQAAWSKLTLLGKFRHAAATWACRTQTCLHHHVLRSVLELCRLCKTGVSSSNPS